MSSDSVIVWRRLDQPALFTTVRREIVESRRETGERSREGLNGEHARQQARRNSESAIAAKAFVNNAG